MKGEAHVYKQSADEQIRLMTEENSRLRSDNIDAVQDKIRGLEERLGKSKGDLAKVKGQLKEKTAALDA